jgi:hypothetical protein
MFVFPMAGLSRRFAEAGYDRPKYMLEAGGRSLFAHVVDGFRAVFDDGPFIFVVRDLMDSVAFVKAQCAAIGAPEPIVIALKEPTGGQAETVAIGLDRAGVGDDDAMTIFNIDTLRPAFAWPDDPAIMAGDGYLEVFRGEGANWSFVRPESPGSTRVAETTEKRPISDLCCTGLYHFRRAGDFRTAFADAAASGAREAGEYYVAPLYNRLIARGLDVRYAVIPREAVIFSGVPEEYEALRRSLEA